MRARLFELHMQHLLTTLRNSTHLLAIRLHLLAIRLELLDKDLMLVQCIRHLPPHVTNLPIMPLFQRDFLVAEFRKLTNINVVFRLQLRAHILQLPPHCLEFTQSNVVQTRLLLQFLS